MGTLTALQLAAVKPELIQSLVLISPRYNVENYRKVFQLIRKRPGLLLPLYLSLRDPLGEESFPWGAKHRLNVLDSRIAGRYMDELLDLDLSDILASLKVPVCLIVGDHNRITPPHIAEEMNEILPNSQLIHYGHRGHNPHHEDPENINQIILDFISSRDGPVGRRLKTFRTWWGRIRGVQKPGTEPEAAADEEI